MANDLRAYLTEQIKKQGSINLGTFIENVVIGYYNSKTDYPIGKHGDFITAPEVSQMFGEVIGAWVIDLWRQMGGGEITLIECGPGRGTLMADILRVASKVPDFTKMVQIRFIETGEPLVNLQKKAVDKYIDTDQVTWSDSLLAPEGNCIILGNEFLDTLPIEQVIREEEKWYQKVIELSLTGEFCFGEKAMDKELMLFLPEHVCDNEIYEISPVRIRFIKDCLRIMKNGSGAALFIDYGHIKTHYGDTLQALRKHEYTDIFENVGRSDITSHIDFESLVNVIKKQDFCCEPVITQRRFLKNLGIEHRASVLAENSKEIYTDLERLIGHNQMGDLFKVMCFYNGEIKPEGF